jgi:ribosome-associated protein
MSLEPVDLAKKIVEMAADKQAADVVLLDTRKICSFADYFVICSGDSDRQIEAIHRAIAEALKEEGDVHYHSEGTAASGWMLLDLGNIVVHIFSPLERDFYQLESLWSAAPVIVKMI